MVVYFYINPEQWTSRISKGERVVKGFTNKVAFDLKFVMFS